MDKKRILDKLNLSPSVPNDIALGMEMGLKVPNMDISSSIMSSAIPPFIDEWEKKTRRNSQNKHSP